MMGIGYVRSVKSILQGVNQRRINMVDIQQNSTYSTESLRHAFLMRPIKLLDFSLSFRNMNTIITPTQGYQWRRFKIVVAAIFGTALYSSF